MHVTVSLKSELNATASLSQMESHIQQADREARKDALKPAIRHMEGQEKHCARCGSERVYPQGTRRSVFLTCFGRVEVALKRLRCEACGQRFRPAERCLAEVKGSNVTPELRELAALVGCSWPYETAAGVLKQVSGVQLSDERVRQLTNEQGRTLAQEQQSEARQVLQEAVSMKEIRAQREQCLTCPQAEQPEWLQIGLDGGWLPSREQKGGMEGKVGVVASERTVVGKHGRHR